MIGPDNGRSDARPARTGENEAIRHMEREIISGKPWYIALLEAIGIWDLSEETYRGRVFHYLVSDEAFDWLLLAERLCLSVEDLIPQEERDELLFKGKPPLRMPHGEFRKLIGEVKYHLYLNYFYGITVEEALVFAVEDEVRKEKRVAGYYRETDTATETYRRIYGATKPILLRRFRKEKKYSQLKSIRLAELKEFTYWLFTFRIKNNDKAKVASDTKKALDWLKSKGLVIRPDSTDYEQDITTVLIPESM